MKSLKFTIPLILGLFSAGAIAGADSAPKFGTLDANGNDSIEMKEAKKHEELASRFRELDADNNGRLSRDEYSQFTSS